MVNVDLRPMVDASARRIRTQEEWNVEIHMRWAAYPMSRSMRSFISRAALLVKVIARISCGRAAPVRIRWAIRRVSTAVLPELKHRRRSAAESRRGGRPPSAAG